MSSGCPAHVGCVTSHSGTCMGRLDFVSTVDDNDDHGENEDENGCEMVLLADDQSLKISKSNLLNVEMPRTRKLSGLAGAFRRKSTVDKYRRLDCLDKKTQDGNISQ